MARFEGARLREGVGGIFRGEAGRWVCEVAR